MRQELEIEFKNMLTKEEFELLIHTYHLTKNDFICQENHYFDTLDFSLKRKQAALRIRIKQNQFVLTLKQKQPKRILETHQDLTKKEALSLINGAQFHMLDEKFIHIFKRLEIDPKDLHYLGSLKTDRAEIKDNGHLLVLDHSFYLGHEDYELEFEVKDAEIGKQYFLTLLQQHNIPHRPTQNKIQRFFQMKEKKED